MSLKPKKREKSRLNGYNTWFTTVPWKALPNQEWIILYISLWFWKQNKLNGVFTTQVISAFLLQEDIKNYQNQTFLNL